MRSGDHVAQTYQDPASLRRAVGSWIAPALRRRGGALLVCTPTHADLVRAELRDVALDPEAAEREGRLVVKDAEDLLSRFMVDDMPQGAAFKRIARELVRSIAAASAPGPIRAWGEMVDVLAKSGRPEAANRLEALWNEIIAEADLQLLCSYELDVLDPAAHARVLLDVCHSHTDLVPEEGPALDGAVSRALDEVFGPEEARVLRRVLPTRSLLLERMSAGSAMLMSLRALHPELGEEVAHRARRHIATRAAITAATRAPR